MRTKFLLAFMLLAIAAFGQQNPIQIDANGLTQTLASGGIVSRGQIVKINSAGQVVPMATTDTSGAIGIAATSQQNQGQSITVSIAGTPLILLDGSCTAGNLVLISSTSAGSGHCSANVQGQQIGVALSASAPGSLFWNVQLSPNSAGSAGNPDPPISQNYTLTATGAQTAINLTAAPIDTHILSWRLTSGGLTQTISDSVSYANGDLHTANANWVYQTGSFTVASNTIYGSAASNLAYRNDGANTGNEWAQATVTITGAAATQSVGPCVRVQTASQSAYCVQVASDTIRIILENSGSFSFLQVFNPVAVTGDIIKVQAIGSTIYAYRNGILLGSTVDTTLTTGRTGLMAQGNATVNGATNFVSGTIVNCTVAVDSSPDGVTWTAGGAVPAQTCSIPGSLQNAAIANYVRVNVTALDAAQTLSAVYSGRLANSANVGTASVSNGQYVNAGEVIWTQITSQGVSGISVSTAVRIASLNGVINTSTVTVGNCATGSTPGGVGFAFFVPVSGWLQSITTQENNSGLPQGTLYINHYLMTSLPNGGTTNSCTGSFTNYLPVPMLLSSGVTGSFYPVSFVGTTAVPQSPWSIPGFTTTLTQANPAAGAEFSFTAPINARTCVQSVSFTLAAGSTNVNPTIVFTINGSKLVYTAATAQTSATTQNYSFSPGANAEAITAGATVFHIVPFNNGQPACFNSGLSAGTITSVTTGLNATTQYSNISFLVQMQQDND